MAALEVTCKDQSLEWVQDPPEMYSGNIKIDSITFNFCELWDGYTKTAVFYRDKSEVINVLLDETNACTIPPEMTEKKGCVYIGVFGVKRECRRTTAPKSFYLKEGSLTDGKPSEPTPDIYQQIITLCTDATEAATRAETTASNAEEKAQEAVDIANSVRIDGDIFTTIASITVEEAVNAITIDEKLFPDIAKVKDFYIGLSIERPETAQSGNLLIKCKTNYAAPALAVIKTWNHVSYVMNGNFYSKCFYDGFRFNSCAETLGANNTQAINLATTIAQIREPLQAITIQCAATTSFIPVGSKITIKGYVGK